VLQVAEGEYVSEVRASYDAAAESYAQVVGTELNAAMETALDRALLAAFAESFAGAAAHRVADLGCGPGRVAAFLARHGINVLGVDVSPAMLTVARGAHPHISVAAGRLSALPVPDRSLAGAVCWYSIIHTPPARLPEVCVELARVLASDGHLLVGFQAGTGEGVHRVEAYGTRVSLTSYRHDPDEVTRCLTEVGFRITGRAMREPERPHETTPQAFVFARVAHPITSVAAERRPT
jgi:ubiquinone/menaquinone biosynthesis C-methylase UbiE